MAPTTDLASEPKDVLVEVSRGVSVKIPDMISFTNNFGSVKPGQAFVFNGSLYIKVGCQFDKGFGVNLQTGDRLDISPKEFIQLAEVEVVSIVEDRSEES